MPRRIRMPVSRRARIAAAVGVVALLVAATAVSTSGARSYNTSSRFITVHDGPGGRDVVRIDTTLYVPSGVDAGHPAPAVIEAHGFGGSKNDTAAASEALARHGYVVLAYSNRGFGRSTGRVALDAPDYEVRDASALIDYLATLPEVRRDAPGDPRVGMTGDSYGGGISLMTASYDRRVDAIVPGITWNSLVNALSPNFATPVTPSALRRAAVPGVLKQQWASVLFSSAGVGSNEQPGVCGHFVQAICDAYVKTAQDGHATPAIASLLAASSPASRPHSIHAPTLLIQGQSDSLFGLGEADANARNVVASGTPLQVVWGQAGHDARPSSDEISRQHALTAAWFDRYLKGDRSATTRARFLWERSLGQPDGRAGRYPPAQRTSTVSLTPLGFRDSSGRSWLISPPGGLPSSTTSVPGASGLDNIARALGGLLTDPMGEFVAFESAPLEHAVEVIGAPNVRITATSSTGSAHMFAKLYDVPPEGSAILPHSLVSAIDLEGLPPPSGHRDATSRQIQSGNVYDVTLPWIAYRFEAGHRLRLVIASTDSAYVRTPRSAIYTVGLGGSGGGNAASQAGRLSLPEVVGAASVNTAPSWMLVVAAAFAFAALAVAVGWFITGRYYRRIERDVDPALIDVPLAGGDLSKTYRDGLVAVDHVEFTCQAGQIVGLLGPNGSGKTTLLRMALGLIHPTGGEMRIFGQRVVPGAQNLARIGALVEGPGLLPHLTGRENLELYWETTGRPLAHANFDEVLAVARLGHAIDRTVKSYSHGMRQRLAIAQAMLGSPDVLVLDEPTNGLDPPQIHDMRDVLRRYAATGRAVILASHLLAEVEQVCTHILVLDRGRLVAAGPIDEFIGTARTVVVDVDSRAAARAALSRVQGLGAITDTINHNSSLSVVLGTLGAADVVSALVRAGVRVKAAQSRHRLEDVFLTLVEDPSRVRGTHMMRGIVPEGEEERPTHA